MKYIKKTITDERTGATADYHEISAISIDYVNSVLSVIISTFVSKEMKDEGKEAIAQNSIYISDTFPETRETCINTWILDELVKQKPEDVENEMLNRYMFAGGTIENTTA